MLTLGVIGTGNMGEALLRGALQAGAVTPEQVMIFDTDSAKAARLKDSMAVLVADSLEHLLHQADIFLLAVKPNAYHALLETHHDAFSGKALLSIAAGWSAERLHSCLPDDARVLRIMPNTPSLVGEGMTVFEGGDTLLPEEKVFAGKLFSAIGKVETVDAKLMNAATSVSGSGPAYMYMFIEALADGGLRETLHTGLPHRL